MQGRTAHGTCQPVPGVVNLDGMKDRRKQPRAGHNTNKDRRKLQRPPDHLITRLEDVTYNVMRKHQRKGGTVR